jgi:hypothetical protein
VEVTTPVGDTRPNTTSSTQARHGDVDRNGDLVDELTTVLRLRSAITGATPEEGESQLRAVVRMLRRRGFEELRP